MEFTMHCAHCTCESLPDCQRYIIMHWLLLCCLCRCRDREKEKKRENWYDGRTHAHLIRWWYAVKSGFHVNAHTQHFIDMFRYSSFSSRICAAALMQNTNRVLQFQRIFSHWLSFLACIHVLSLTFPFQYDDQIKGHTIVIKYTNKWLD